MNEGISEGHPSASRQWSSRGTARWPVVIGAAIGISLNPGVLAFYVMGALMQPIRDATGWSHTEIAAGPALLSGMLIFTVPLAGNFMDRFGVRKVVIPSQIALSLLLIALGFTASLPQFLACYAAMGIFAAGAVSVGQMRAICSWFDKDRGLAVGLAASGLGVGTMITPWVTQTVLEQGDWRLVYAVLGALVLLISVPATFLLLRECPRQRAREGKPDSELIGLTQRQVIHTREFWMVVAIFALLSGGLASVSVHLGAILMESGATKSIALSALTPMGAGMVLGRLLTGALLDRFFGARVFAIITTLVAGAVAVLAIGATGPALLLAVAMTGFGVGAEGDVIFYLASRYFGLRALGAVGGYLFVANSVGNLLFPLLAAGIADRFGSYTGALALSCASICCSAVILFLLTPFPQPPEMAGENAFRHENALRHEKAATNDIPRRSTEESR
jgi:MFS family permease